MKVSPEILNMEPYRPGKPISEAQREFGLEKVYKLASNENSLGTSPLALTAIKKALEAQFRYPDPTCYDLLQISSKKWGFPVSRLCAGNGSDELIDLLVRIYCEPGDGILTSVAAFAAYEVSAHSSRVIPYKIPLKSDYGFDLKAMADFFLTHPEKNIRLIFIANPNNPTGVLSKQSEMDDFFKKLGGRDDVLIVLDEAYTEFVRDPSYRGGFHYAREHSNVVVLRTFSKVYGLAGLRVGIMVAPDSVVEIVNRVRKPFNVNDLAQVAAAAALEDTEFIQRTQNMVWKGLDYFYQQLALLGLPYVKSEGNFVFFDTLRDVKLVNHALLKRGVILRPLLNYGFKSHLRMSVGTNEENVAAIAALKEVIHEIPANKTN